MESISDLLSVKFMPHGHCYYWRPEIVWPHVIGDGLTALSYYVIPLILLGFIKKRKDIEFQNIFVAFAAFILACGTVHILAIVSIWEPIYRIEAVAKLFMAFVSFGTVLLLWKKMPDILTIPSPKQLSAVKEQLEGEMASRKAKENELWESEQRFRVAMEHAPIGKSILDIDGNWINSNTALRQMFGYSADEMHKLSFKELVVEEDWYIDKELKEKLLRNEINAYNVEKRYINSDGEVIWGNLNCALVRDNEDKPMYYIYQVLDITKRKHAEEQMLALNQSLEEKVKARTMELEAANKNLESFSYSVSHDLRNPLTAINLYCNIIEDEFNSDDNEELKQMVQGIANNCQRMETLITDLLEFSRAGRKALEPELLNMEKLFRSVYDEIVMAAEEDDPEVQFEVGDLPDAFADETMIRQVVANLVGNAVKYSSKKPQPIIEVGATIETDSVTYFIKDNGVGFDPKKADKLFIAFERLHDTSEFDGTGVGLALVKKIINLHEGRIWAESEPGKGSTFFFSLPINNL